MSWRPILAQAQPGREFGGGIAQVWRYVCLAGSAAVAKSTQFLWRWNAQAISALIVNIPNRQETIMRLTLILCTSFFGLALAACSQATQDHAGAAADQAGAATASAAQDAATTADKTAGVAARKADAAADAAAKTH